MILNEKYTLANGIEIPKIGLETWLIDNESVAKAVKEAVKWGYRHIDTAQAYQNEVGVSKGIKDCGVDRKELFITTKLAAEIKNYDEAVKAIDESLSKLSLDYVDMMIIHSPKPWNKYGEENRYFEGNREAWRAQEDDTNREKFVLLEFQTFYRKI